MRDLQDSEELEKLFKPYAFKNKVLMVKKMAAVLHKIFWNLSWCKVKPLRTSWYLMVMVDIFLYGEQVHKPPASCPCPTYCWFNRMFMSRNIGVSKSAFMRNFLSPPQERYHPSLEKKPTCRHVWIHLLVYTVFPNLFHNYAFNYNIYIFV